LLLLGDGVLFPPLPLLGVVNCRSRITWSLRARSRLYMGPNLFRPPRIRSALTAIKKLIQLFMIVILYLIKIILAWRDQRKSVRKNRIMWRTRATQESPARMTFQVGPWLINIRTPFFSFIIIIYYVCLFFFWFGRSPTKIG
jgi:hypothetical protein